MGRNPYLARSAFVCFTISFSITISFILADCFVSVGFAAGTDFFATAGFLVSADFRLPCSSLPNKATAAQIASFAINFSLLLSKI